MMTSKNRVRKVATYGSDNTERRVARAINTSWPVLAGYTYTDTAQRMIRARNIDGLISNAPWGNWTQNLGGVIDPMTRQVANSIRDDMRGYQGLNAALRMDVIDDLSVRYAQAQSSKLIVNLGDSQRATVRAVMGRALQGELTVDQAARRIRDTIGLHPAWAEAVDKMNGRQFAAAMKGGASVSGARTLADTRSARYAESLRRKRALMVARTEIHISSGLGRLASHETAVLNGFAALNSRKEWSAGPNACPICRKLAGEIVLWDDEYPNGELIAHGHPGCRCTDVHLPPEYGDGDLDPEEMDWVSGGPSPFVNTMTAAPSALRTVSTGRSLASTVGQELAIRALTSRAGTDLAIRGGTALAGTMLASNPLARQLAIAATTRGVTRGMVRLRGGALPVLKPDGIYMPKPMLPLGRGYDIIPGELIMSRLAAVPRRAAITAAPVKPPAPAVTTALDWAPVMGEGRAKSWVSGSAVTADVFHGTPSIKNAETIRAKGFDASKSGSRSGDKGFSGEGFYFSADAFYAGQYARMLSSNPGETLRAKVRLTNPWVDDVGAGKTSFADFVTGWEKSFIGDQGKRVDARAEAVRAEALRRGHDGIIAYHAGAIHEIVVFDQKKVVVVDDRVGRSVPAVATPAAGWAKDIEIQRENARTVSSSAVPLSKAEKEALEGYVDQEYRDLNGILRAGDFPEGELGVLFSSLDMAFRVQKPLPAPVTVYRGLDWSVLSNVAKGATFKDGGYGSTSLSEGDAALFANHGARALVMRVTVPGGTKVLPASLRDDKQGMDDIRGGEGEIILNRKTSYRITSEPVLKKFDQYSDKGKLFASWEYWTVDAEAF